MVLGMVFWFFYVGGEFGYIYIYIWMIRGSFGVFCYCRFWILDLELWMGGCGRWYGDRDGDGDGDGMGRDKGI